MQEPIRQPLGRADVQNSFGYDLESDSQDVIETQIGHAQLPVPEPEAQPSQRPAADPRPQRPIRRMDPKALDLPRGSRNSPPGDVIDIPAFLRKR